MAKSATHIMVTMTSEHQFCCFSRFLLWVCSWSRFMAVLLPSWSRMILLKWGPWKLSRFFVKCEPWFNCNGYCKTELRNWMRDRWWPPILDVHILYITLLFNTFAGWCELEKEGLVGLHVCWSFLNTECWNAFTSWKWRMYVPWMQMQGVSLCGFVHKDTLLGLEPL